MAGSTTRKDVELRITASSDLSAKPLAELIKTFEDLQKAQDELNKSAGEGGRHIRELTGDVTDLKKVALELAARSGLVDQFNLLEAAATKAGTRVESAKEKLTAFNATLKAGEELTGKQQTRLNNLSASVAKAEAAFDKAKGRVAEMGAELERLGAGGAEQSRQEFLKLGSSIGDALGKAESAVKGYDAALRQNAAAEAEATAARNAAIEAAKREEGVQRLLAKAARETAVENQKAAQAEVDAAQKRAEGVQRILAKAHAQNITDQKAAQDQLGKLTAFQEQGADAAKTATHVEVLTKDYDALAASSKRAGDGIRVILDPSGAALKSLSSLEAEVEQFNNELEKTKGDPGLANALKVVRGEYVGFAQDAGKATAKLADSIGEYRQAEQAVGTLGAKVEAAAADVRKFGSEMAKADTPSKELADSLAAAKSRLATLSNDFERQSTTLAGMRANLREAGVATDQLAAAEKRLDTVARTVAKSHDTLGIATARTGGLTKNLAKDVDLVRERMNAVRLIGPQITDIVTSLQAGQNPLTVLLQQGGQLRDVFGGFGPMFRAFGSLLSPMVVGIGALAAVVGVLGLAWFKSFKEQEAFRKSLILTGNIAGQTRGSMEAIARALSGRSILSLGEAKEAGQAAVSTGRFDVRQIEAATEAIGLWAKITGRTAEETKHDYAGMADDVLGWVKTHNKSMGFASSAVYEHIKALVEQGKTNEAMTVAQEAFNQHLRKQNEDLGKVNTAVVETNKGWSAFWEWLKKIGDEGETFENSVEGMRKKIEELDKVLERQRKAFGPDAASKTAEARGAEATKEEVRERLKLERQSAAVRAKAAEAEAQQRKAIEDSEFLEQVRLEAMDDVTRARYETEKKIVKFREAAANARAAGDPKAPTVAQESQQIAALRARNEIDTRQRRIEAAKNEADLTKRAIDFTKEIVEESYKEGLTTLRDYYAARKELADDALVAQISAARKEIAILGEVRINDSKDKRAENAAKVKKLEGDILELERQRGTSGKAITFEAKEAEKALRRQLDATTIELENLTGNETQAGMRAIQQMYEDRLKIVNLIADVSMRDRRESELNELVQIKIQQLYIDTTAKRVEAINSLRDASIDAAVASGQLSHFDELLARSESNKEKLKALEDRAEAYRLMGDAGKEAYLKIIEQIVRMRPEIDLVAKEMNAVFKDAASNFIEAWRTGNLVDGFHAIGNTLGKALAKSFGDTFSTAIAEVIKESVVGQLFKSMIKGGIGGLFSGLTGLFSSTPSWGNNGPNVMTHDHTGGVVGVGSHYKKAVNPLVFLRAPHYHAGGLPGLRRDEVATILQRGEQVLSRNDPNNVFNRSKQAPGAAGGPLVVQLHPDAMHMTLKDWLEGELARVGARQ